MWVDTMDVIELRISRRYRHPHILRGELERNGFAKIVGEDAYEYVRRYRPDDCVARIARRDAVEALKRVNG